MTEKLLNYFGGDDMAASTWLNKYAQEGDETPDDMHRRMAKEFARMEFQFRGTLEERKYAEVDKLSDFGRKLWERQGGMTQDEIEWEIYGYFKDFRYIVPQGSVMSQLGSKSIGSLSNCFVAGQPEDSYGGIFLKEQEMVQLMKRRGGVGIDLSTLRPKATPTSNAAKTSTGMVSFMDRYSNGTREVAQDGRRGALMLSVDIKHPDAMDFIKIKRDTSKVTGANISVKIGDAFMSKVVEDKDYIQVFPTYMDFNANDMFNDNYNELYHYEGSRNNKVYTRKVKAKEIWTEVIKSAHSSAEPGILFWDNVINNSPDGVYAQYRPVSTNPCGEVPMQPYDACRLIAPNLYSMVKSPFTKDAEIDYDLVYKIFYMAMRYSDDLVELELEHIGRILDKIESDPEPEEEKLVERNLWIKVRDTAQASRRTGLGYTALGDMIAAIGLRYDEDDALKVIEKVMRTKFKAEWTASIDMAILRGEFEGWNPAKEFVQEISPKGDTIKGANQFYQMMLEEFPDIVSRMIQHGRRNVSLSTLAPTGTVSMMTKTTSGIEPVFALWYGRRRKVNPNDKNARIDFVDAQGDAWEKFNVVHPKFKTWLKTNNILTDEDIKNMSEETLKFGASQSPYHKATANDIDWIKRVQIQAIIQKYTSHSISSTINLPRDVSEETVGEIYMESWKQGLKGITVYRDGSRDGVLITEEKKEEITTFHENHAPTRPKYLDAKLVRFNNNKEKWIAFVGFMDGKPYEIFTGKLDDINIPTKIEEGQIGKVRDENGVKRYDFIHEDGIVGGINAVFNEDYWNYAKMISSTLRHGMPLHFAVEMVKGLTFAEDHINTWKNGVARALKKFVPDGEAKGLKCREEGCGSTNIIFEEGCHKCRDCGSSKCG